MRNFNKPSRQKMDQLTERLAEAYRSKGTDDMPPPEKWRQNVMRSIRLMGTLEEKNNRERFGYLTWRLAPVAAVLLILMSIWTKQVDDTLEFQIASLIVNDPAQADVYDPF
jgi:hypothetical protein